MIKSEQNTDFDSRLVLPGEYLRTTDAVIVSADQNAPERALEGLSNEEIAKLEPLPGASSELPALPVKDFADEPRGGTLWDRLRRPFSWKYQKDIFGRVRSSGFEELSNKEINNPQNYSVCRLIASEEFVDRQQGSGVVVNYGSQVIVVTAAHILYRPEKGIDSDMVKVQAGFPAFTQGSWKESTQFYISQNWRNGSREGRHDFAFVAIDNPLPGRSLMRLEIYPQADLDRYIRDGQRFAINGYWQNVYPQVKAWGVLMSADTGGAFGKIVARIPAVSGASGGPLYAFRQQGAGYRAMVAGIVSLKFTSPDVVTAAISSGLIAELDSWLGTSGLVG